jgi:hypothetical protein
MADFVTLRLDRKSVNALNLRAPLLALEQMIVSATTVREFAGRVHVTFDGYDDAADVFLDASVQRFVSELTDLFPYWLHFADKQDDTLRLLMCCLLPPRRIESGDGNAQFEIDFAAWSDQLIRLRRYTTRLHVQFEITPSEASSVSRSVEDWMKKVGISEADPKRAAGRSDKA